MSYNSSFPLYNPSVGSLYHAATNPGGSIGQQRRSTSGTAADPFRTDTEPLSSHPSPSLDHYASLSASRRTSAASTGWPLSARSTPIPGAVGDTRQLGGHGARSPSMRVATPLGDPGAFAGEQPQPTMGFASTKGYLSSGGPQTGALGSSNLLQHGIKANTAEPDAGILNVGALGDSRAFGAQSAIGSGTLAAPGGTVGDTYAPPITPGPDLLASRGAPPPPNWVYIDLSGSWQGPFPSTQMAEWVSFFTDTVLVKREQDPQFLAFGLLKQVTRTDNPFRLSLSPDVWAALIQTALMGFTDPSIALGSQPPEPLNPVGTPNSISSPAPIRPPSVQSGGADSKGLDPQPTTPTPNHGTGATDGSPQIVESSLADLSLSQPGPIGTPVFADNNENAHESEILDETAFLRVRAPATENAAPSDGVPVKSLRASPGAGAAHFSRVDSQSPAHTQTQAAKAAQTQAQASGTAALANADLEAAWAQHEAARVEAAAALVEAQAAFAEAAKARAEIESSNVEAANLEAAQGQLYAQALVGAAPAPAPAPAPESPAKQSTEHTPKQASHPKIVSPRPETVAPIIDPWKRPSLQAMSLAEIKQKEMEKQKKPSETPGPRKVQAKTWTQLPLGGGSAAGTIDARALGSQGLTWNRTPTAAAPKSLAEIQKEAQAKKVQAKQTYSSAAAVTGSGPALPPYAGRFSVLDSSSRPKNQTPPVQQQPSQQHPPKHHQSAHNQQAAGHQSKASRAQSKPIPSVTAAASQARPSDELIQWVKVSLKGLSREVDPMELLDVFLSLPANNEAKEFIAESIYTYSKTLDGRRFAQDFLTRKKEAEQSMRSGETWKDVLNRFNPNVEQDPSFKVVTNKRVKPIARPESMRI